MFFPLDLRLKAAVATLDSKVMGCDQALHEKVDAVRIAANGVKMAKTNTIQMQYQYNISMIT